MCVRGWAGGYTRKAQAKPKPTYPERFGRQHVDRIGAVLPFLHDPRHQLRHLIIVSTAAAAAAGFVADALALAAGIERVFRYLLRRFVRGSRAVGVQPAGIVNIVDIGGSSRERPVALADTAAFL